MLVYSHRVNKRSRFKTFKTLREYVDAQPRQKSQGDIARDLGVSQSALSSYLTGARIPSRDVALRLEEKTGVPVQNLIDPDRAVA